MTAAFQGASDAGISLVRDRTAAQNLTLVREIATKFLKASPGKGSLRSKRKRSALDPRFREGITNLIFQTFGAYALHF